MKNGLVGILGATGSASAVRGVFNTGGFFNTGKASGTLYGQASGTLFQRAGQGVVGDAHPTSFT